MRLSVRSPRCPRATLPPAVPDPQAELDALREQRDRAKRSAAEKRDRLRQAERRQVGAIDKRIRRAEARLRGEARRRDTRRKILAGSWVLSEAERSPAARDKLLRGLDGFLGKDRDRELFELPLKEQS